MRQTIVETLEAPRLTGINTSDFVVFKDKRDLYERKLSEKNSENNTDIPITTYRNSVDESVLEFFYISGWIPVASIDEISEEDLKKCIEDHSKVEDKDLDLGRIERELRSVRMKSPNKKAGLEKQVWNLVLLYTSTLRNCGYVDFLKNQPKLAVKHIMKRLEHEQLSARIRMLLDLRKDELYSDFNKFVRICAEEAKVLDAAESARSYAEVSNNYDSENDDHFSAKKQRGARKKFDRSLSSKLSEDSNRMGKEINVLLNLFVGYRDAEVHIISRIVLFLRKRRSRSLPLKITPGRRRNGTRIGSRRLVSEVWDQEKMRILLYFQLFSVMELCKPMLWLIKVLMLISCLSKWLSKFSGLIQLAR